MHALRLQDFDGIVEFGEGDSDKPLVVAMFLWVARDRYKSSANTTADYSRTSLLASPLDGVHRQANVLQRIQYAGLRCDRLDLRRRQRDAANELTRW